MPPSGKRKVLPMSAIEQLLASYVLNAAWQIPLFYCACAGVLKMRRRTPPGVLHGSWLLCIALAVGLPITGALGLYAPGPVNAGPSLPNPPRELWQAVLGLAILASAYRLFTLIRAGIEAWRLVRSSAVAVIVDARAHGARVYISPATARLHGPLVVGLFRHRIFIPPSLADPANARLLRAALAHELAHVARRDMLLFVVSELALVPLSFHPVTALLRRKLAEAREMACDQRVIDEGMDRFEYARCLLEISAGVAAAPGRIGALAAGTSALERRIQALIAPKSEAAARFGLRAWSPAVLCVAFCSILFAQGSRSVYLWVSAVAAPSVLSLLPPVPPPPPPPPTRNHHP